jgi:FtsP/CotA-like multicopper oxidase with cupredoxin domain
MAADGTLVPAHCCERLYAVPAANATIDHMSAQERSVLGWFAFVVAIGALCVAMFGLVDDSGADAAGGGGGGAAAAAATTVTIELSEFALTPAMVDLPTSGGTLHVVNVGTMAHNVTVAELGKGTGDIQPGGSADIEFGALEAGDYTLLCEIAGHAGSGMTGMLMATEDGNPGAAADAPTTTMSWQQMDAMMEEAAAAFPAETEGHGGETLDPIVLTDGTKEFDLTAEIVKWEVEPGKFVDAWTYNGVVPAPEIHVSSGDKVRIVLQNNLPESTSMHLHGVKVPNSMDGVDPYTQPAIEPGQSFTYEFTADGPAVGIYHSHHDAQVQVPNGLFGAFLIDEMPIPQKLIDEGYTTVDKHVNMVLNDAGTIGLSLNGKSFPATEAYTMKVGEVMEVNYLNEGLMAHPMHLHQPVGWIIAKDGVPLDEPMPGDTINIAPGERYTVLYKAVEPGVWAWHCHILNHAEGPTGMFGMVTALIVEA